MGLENFEGPYIDYIDCMNAIIDIARSEREKDGLTLLVQTLNRSSNFKDLFCAHFCDNRHAMDRLLVKFSKSRIHSWLRTKLLFLEGYIRTNKTYLVEISANPDELSKIFALEVLRCYISENLFTEMIADLGYTTESMFADKTPIESENCYTSNGSASNASAKRPVPTQSHQPSAKKQKDAAIAKTCMKMTAFFKPKS